MSDDIRHDGDNEQIDADAIQPDSVPEPASSQVDPFVEVLRDLPRMRAEEDAGAKPFVPPPPMLVRMGAVTQGCGGVILTLMSLPMLLVAFAFGFYLWGPGLIVASGVVMLLGTPGLWRGNRLSIFIGFGAALVALVVTYMWRYFVLAVAILSPLGAMVEVIYSLGVMVGALVIVGILILMIFGLLYWRRLHPPTSRALMVWAAILILLIAVPLVSSVFEQQNRRDWLETHRDDWTAQAQIDSLVLGANSNVALGYTFASSEPADAEKLFETREAELLAALETGANPIRLTASGDSLLEQAEPRLYVDDEDEGDKNDDAADQDDAAGATSGEDDTQDGAQAELPGELQIQFELEARYLARFEESGADIFLSDSQYSPYLLVRAQDEDENLSWEQFTELHEERIRYYASTLKPAIYAVVSEPAAYATYSAIDLPGGDDDPDRNLDAWVSHLKRLITIVEEESPDTRIAVSITLDDDLNADFYERVLGLDGLDIITLEVYQPSSFERVQDLLDERGHPLDFGQELWISETWYGFCMAPQRSMELDAMWLDVVVAFAASEGFRGVLPNHYGCFLQAGGTMIEPNVDLDGRTEVWEKWRDLVAQWQMPLEETESTPADGD